jgi:uncharacterized membrane protein YjgN (DUF898 family)
VSVSTPGDTATAPSRPASAAPSAGEPPPRRLVIRFTGSGSEYFGIWIVNLLLTIVTLTIYYPWAKVRKLRYFYGNTEVDGQPLGFHASPLKVLRGYALIVAFGVLYAIASRVSPVAGVVAFALLAGLWPALLKSTLQFRLANTSWRGLRLRFAGNLADAYRACWPACIPLLAFVMAGALAPAGRPRAGAGGPLMGLAVLALVALLPLLVFRLRRYQHDHYVYGPIQTRFAAGPGAFYALAAKALGLVVIGGIVAFAVVAALAGALGVALQSGTGRNVGVAIGIAIGLLGALLAIVGINLAVRPYVSSRLQNLVWSRTGHRWLRFQSDLRFWALFRLFVKNGLLVTLTLGLYWPFAAVSLARLRIEALSILTRVDPQTLATQARAVEGDAVGDAAGDFFGIDIGF